jgi:hypothetical protein
MSLPSLNVAARRSKGDVLGIYDIAGLPPGVVAIPAGAWMWTESVHSLFRVTQGMPRGSRMSMARNATSSSIAANRNKLVEGFLLDMSYKWILFLDSDMVPRVDTIPRLLSHNVDIVSALYFQRSEPFLGVYSELPDAQPVADGDPDLREVLFAGAGCLLVRRPVLDAMARPCWEHPSPGGEEDSLFCEKARALGFKVHVDLGHSIGHMAARAIDEELVTFYQRY